MPAEDRTPEFEEGEAEVERTTCDRLPPLRELLSDRRGNILDAHVRRIADDIVEPAVVERPGEEGWPIDGEAVHSRKVERDPPLVFARQERVEASTTFARLTLASWISAPKRWFSMMSIGDAGRADSVCRDSSRSSAWRRKTPEPQAQSQTLPAPSIVCCTMKSATGAGVETIPRRRRSAGECRRSEEGTRSPARSVDVLLESSEGSVTASIARETARSLSTRVRCPRSHIGRGRPRSRRQALLNRARQGSFSQHSRHPMPFRLTNVSKSIAGFAYSSL